MARRREADELAPVSQTKRSSTVMCTICKEFGYNKRTCRHGPVKRKRSSSSSKGSKGGGRDDARNGGTNPGSSETVIG